jgi:hypothetical protein
MNAALAHAGQQVVASDYRFGGSVLSLVVLRSCWIIAASTKKFSRGCPLPADVFPRLLDAFKRFIEQNLLNLDASASFASCFT